MTIEQCRKLDCVHVSHKRRRRNCGVTDCSSYPNFYEKRWFEEEGWEFSGCEDEEKIRADLYTTYWKDAIPTLKYRSVADAIDNLPKSWKGTKHVTIKYYNGEEFKCSVILGNIRKVAYKPLFYSKEDSNRLAENNGVNNGIYATCINMETSELLETPSSKVLETLYYLACSSLHALGEHTEYTDIFCSTPINIDTNGNSIIRDSTKEMIEGLIRSLQDYS